MLKVDTSQLSKTNKMAREKGAPTLDMNHGFVHSIIKNQIDRDEYDKEQKLMKLEKEKQSKGEVKEERKRKERRAPLHQVYVPPHMRKASTNNTEQSSTSKETSEPELMIRLEFEGKDGQMSYLDITKADDLKKSVRQFAFDNGLDSRLRDALYHKLYLELRGS